MRLECHYSAMRQIPDRQEEHLRDGYLSVQTGGRSRFISKYFWAGADVEVSCKRLSLICSFPSNILSRVSIPTHSSVIYHYIRRNHFAHKCISAIQIMVANLPPILFLMPSELRSQIFHSGSHRDQSAKRMSVEASVLS